MSTIQLELREWEACDPSMHGGEALRDRSLDNEALRGLAAALAQKGILEIVERRDGLRVVARAHVGRIQLGSLTVTVLPKIAPHDLLALLRYVYGLRDLQLLERASFAMSGELLQDLIAHQLAAEVAELRQRGLVKRYVGRTERLSSPRGRIDVRALARSQPMVDSRLDCRFHERSTDHLLNQVLIGGLHLAADVAQGEVLRSRLLRVAHELDETITRISIDARTLGAAERRLDRMSSAYSAALQLIRLLYESRAIELNDQTTVTLQGFLFDMNRFFQRLLGRFLAEHADEWTVREEDSLRGMMRYVDNPRNRRPPTPRPDFVIRDGSRTVALLDAKYRDLWQRELPREMLYQLAMYALSQPGAATASILYPTSDRQAAEARIEIREPVGTSPAGYVALRPVVLQDLVQCIEPGQERAARDLARRWILGQPASSLRS